MRQAARSEFLLGSRPPLDATKDPKVSHGFLVNVPENLDLTYISWEGVDCLYQKFVREIVTWLDG